MINAKSAPLHRGQALLNKCIERNPDVFSWVIITPRQWGKTTYLLLKGLEWCANNPDSYLWYVTPYNKTSQDIFDKKLLPMIGPYIGSLINTVRVTIREIVINTSGAPSYFKFESAENFQGLRGPSLTHLICDEFAYFRPGAYEQVLAPMLARRGQKELFVSTPFGKNHFYKYFQRGNRKSKDYEKGWASFRGNAEMTRDEVYLQYIAKQRALHPPDIYRQEYEAAFIDSGGAVFKNIDRIVDKSKREAAPTARNFVGIDLGQDHDRTVIVVLNEHCEIVRLKRFEVAEQQDSTRLVAAITEELNQLPDFTCWIEKNFNAAIIDFLWQGSPSLKRKVRPWTTTNKTKAKAINDLVVAIDLGEIKVPASIDQTLFTELNNYTFKHSGQILKYGAPDGEHDDTVMALAIAYQNYKKTTKRTKASFGL